MTMNIYNQLLFPSLKTIKTRSQYIQTNEQLFFQTGGPLASQSKTLLAQMKTYSKHIAVERSEKLRCGAVEGFVCVCGGGGGGVLH